LLLEAEEYESLEQYEEALADGIRSVALDGTVVGWKESGGYAGTMSPNAAYVQAVVPITASSAHTATVTWKTNRRAGTATIFAAAGSGAPYSPTALAAELISC
jgi:uncharacterized protein YfaP (DUF2135 family)